MASKTRLIDTLREAELQAINDEQKNSAVRRTPVEQIAPRNAAKDKQISAKVNAKMYNAFVAINQAQGISNNSALNMLMSKYVRENCDLLN